MTECDSKPKLVLNIKNNSAIADTGTTGNYLPIDAPCINKKLTNNPISICMPNGHLLQSTHTALLNNKLPIEAREAHLFPGLRKALISIGLLCDNGCIATFDEDKVTIINKKDGKIIMTGGRELLSRLYTLTLQAPNLRTEINSPEKLSASNVYECKSKQQLIEYHHASCWSPVKSTWTKATSNNFFTSWPGLTTSTINKYLGKSEPTILGHLRQTRQGIRSTKNKLLKKIT